MPIVKNIIANSEKYHSLLMHFFYCQFVEKELTVLEYSVYNIRKIILKCRVLDLSLYEPFSKIYIIVVFNFVLINN